MSVAVSFRWLACCGCIISLAWYLVLRQWQLIMQSTTNTLFLLVWLCLVGFGLVCCVFVLFCCVLYLSFVYVVCGVFFFVATRKMRWFGLLLFKRFFSCYVSFCFRFTIVFFFSFIVFCRRFVVSPRPGAPRVASLPGRATAALKQEEEEEKRRWRVQRHAHPTSPEALCAPDVSLVHLMVSHETDRMDIGFRL